MAKTMKTAISIPKSDYELLEKLRKETGKSRSQILVEAFHETVKRREQQEIDRQYEEAYRRMPETKEELKELGVWAKESSKVWGKMGKIEEW